MTKLCARGKAAAKRKFRVYPSAYANAYASKICAGKIKDPSGLKRKDFKGPKPAGKKIGGEAKIKEVAKALHKASGLHKAQAKALDSVTKANVGIAVDRLKEREKKEKRKKYNRPPQSRDKMQPSRSMSIDTTTKIEKLSRGGGAAIRGMGFKGVF
jgi:hypothetical protein